VAHALRGAAGHFGLTEMVHGCERLEGLAGAGALEGAPQAVADLESAFARAQGALNAASADTSFAPEVDLVHNRA
jgi:HPt (histidine-containing phosphotransfer) domain-containing protein